MLYRIAFFLIAFFCGFSVGAQSPFYQDYPYPHDAFVNPMGIVWKLSGTFGEPRGNHFHAGSDVKTNGSEGYKLYAVADGSVARIKVSPYGYGKALYIAHPNGFTSVYAHMSAFNDAIDSLVKQYQYASRKFEQDIYLKPGVINLKQGEVIGLSGNSGGSAGPHLHFEIRHSASQHIINPLFFGYPVPDHRPPSVLGVKVTSVADSYYHALEEGRSAYFLTASLPDTIPVVEGNIAIGIHGYDQHDAGANKNGIFRLELAVDGQQLLQWTMDKMDFSEGRYVNAFRDFAENKKGRTIYNAFRLPGNQLGLYEYLVNDGYVAIDRGQSALVELKAWDFEGNHTDVTFVLKGLRADEATPDSDSASVDNLLDIQWDANYNFTQKGFHAWFPEGTFYDDVRLTYAVRPAKDTRMLSEVHQLHDAFIPMQKYAVIQIDAPEFPQHLRSKAILVHKDLRGTEQALTSFWKDGMLSGKCREVGFFYARIDTIPPLVQWINYNNKLQSFRGGQVRIKISDNLAGIKDYNGYIDENWVVFDYDAKRNLLTYDYDENCKKGRHELRIVVEDEVGNKTIRTLEFIAE